MRSPSQISIQPLPRDHYAGPGSKVGGRPREPLTRGEITFCLSMVRVALQANDKPRALAAIERAFCAADPAHDLDSPVAALGLPVRTVNALESLGILTVRALQAVSDAELLAVPGFGQKTIEEIREALGP